MRKICLTILGSYLLFIYSFGQSYSDNTSEYNRPSLKLDETNLISNYYTQTGNHSAITGGEGTQALTDISNVIELKFIKTDFSNQNHTVNVDFGYDHHTAASAAYVNNDGTSPKGGARIHASLNWQVENSENLTTFGLGAAISSEYTYHSYGFNGVFAKHSADNNREFMAKGIIFLDEVTMIYPAELRPVTSDVTSTNTSASGSGSSLSAPTIPTELRSTFGTSFSYSQVINKSMQVSFLADLVAQAGYLGLPFHRVYYDNYDKSVGLESLPSSRFKLPLGVRFNYFAGDRVIFRTYYRYYADTWRVTAHTASLEMALKITPFISVSPFYRFYKQTAANFFAPIYLLPVGSLYGTSNYEYSAFNSGYLGVNLRLVPLNRLLGIKYLSMVELRIGHYRQSTGLVANNIALNLQFK
jgi:hypothetical protein